MQCVWQWNICHYIFDTFFIKAALNIYPAPVFLLTPKTVRELWTFIGIEKETLAISVCGKENSVTIFLNMHDCLLLIGHSNIIALTSTVFKNSEPWYKTWHSPTPPPWASPTGTPGAYLHCIIHVTTLTLSPYILICIIVCWWFVNINIGVC